MIEEMIKRFALTRRQVEMLSAAGVFTQEDAQVIAQRISLALSLQKLGLNGEKLRYVLELYRDPLRNRKELLLCLRKRRSCLLENLHALNQRLDEADYLIDALRRHTKA